MCRVRRRVSEGLTIEVSVVLAWWFVHAEWAECFLTRDSRDCGVLLLVHGVPAKRAFAHVSLGGRVVRDAGHASTENTCQGGAPCPAVPPKIDWRTNRLQMGILGAQES